METTHLQALRVRLSRERDRLSAAKTSREREARTVWVAQAEKELADELALLGLTDPPAEEMSADELARELGA